MPAWPNSPRSIRATLTAINSYVELDDDEAWQLTDTAIERERYIFNTEQHLITDMLDKAAFRPTFGLTEPDHGSDPGSMATRALKVAGGYKLTGSIRYKRNA